MCVTNSSVAQRLHKLLLIPLMSVWAVLTCLANADVWIELLKNVQSGLRFVRELLHSGRCNRYSKQCHPVGFVLEAAAVLSAPHLISPGDRTGECGGTLREEHARAERIRMALLRLSMAPSGRQHGSGPSRFAARRPLDSRRPD